MKINLSQAPAAAGKKSKKALRKGYLTTIGFYGMTPTFYWHMTADERIQGSHRLLSRANPMVLPALIDSEFHVNDFYVRKRDIWPAYNHFDQKVIFHFSDGQSGVPGYEPYVLMGDLVKMFTQTSHGLMVAATPSQEDVIARDVNGITMNLNFTTLGAAAFKMLNNLGYRLSWDELDTTHVNCMALLAYIKIYMDWYFPPQYINSLQSYNKIVRVFNNTTTDVYQPTLDAVGEFIINGFGTFCYYDDDNFAVVWERPEGPASANAANYSIGFRDGVVQGFDADGSSNFTPYIDGSVSTNKFSAVGLQFLQKLGGYIKRHQLAGAHFIDRFLLQRGIKLEDSHRAIRLGESRIPVRVGDVESNASATNGNESSVLGELAGKSISWNDKKLQFNYASQSFDGIFISITTLVANARFGTGMDRHNLHHDRLDSWTPEFDNMGVAAVRKDEVYSSLNHVINNSPAGIFGFLPRYYEYLLSRDVLSGNFIIRSFGSVELEGYHLFRDYDVNAANMPLQSNLQMNYSFLTPSTAQQEEMNRLFYSTKILDQFILKFDTVFDSFGPKKPLSNNYDFVGDEGHEIQTVESQGVHIQ